ncbi:cation diffusion facilitator family transporter [Hoeflea phototrophica DFL-43]|uniref:Protein p34 n=1 Tax=Hoeflea phototrophica (strain DSM 17068 / NCIMB 14078 / DFL-43) TaxID=411684 RepID=A9D260_HOEPD|nr:cation diffusion facilitator family transporter [Hoeflea phototrophica]EDQ34139.1 cation diffusion facilitator family transporter [Hoeflea phototrophica DFL-43]
MPDRARTVRRLAFWSIPLALGVMALKFVAWFLTGSIALYSDALESTVNVIAALAAFIAIGYAQKPADTGHPYGHHKAEYFSAVLEGVLIVVAALLIVHEAIGGLIAPMQIEAPALGLAINGSAAVINGIWAFVLIRAGRRYRSPALSADGHHILSDVVTSVGVIAGLILAIMFDQPRLDPLLALIVAINVLWQGSKVISASVGGLMDQAIDPADEIRIHEIIKAEADGAIEAHDIKTRMAGQVSFVEFHLVVDGGMTVEQSHTICDRLEAALKREVDGIQVIIHVEPGHKAKEEGVQLG